MITRLPPIDQKIYNLPVEKQVRELGDYLMRYRRESEFLLNGNIDSTNVRSITTDQLVAGSAKIKTAMIESLEVGRNVIMGPNATISWSKVTNQPSIPVVPSYIKSTYIDSVTVQSPTIIGGSLTAGVSTKITISNYGGSGEIRFKNALNTDIAQIKFNANLSELLFQDLNNMAQMIISGSQGLSLMGSGSGIEIYSGGIDLLPKSGQQAKYNGSEIATRSWVSSNFLADGNDNYVKSHTGQDLSIVATETGIAIRVNGITLGSIFYS